MREDNRLNHFLKTNDRKILSPYITAGFPSLELTVPLMHALVEAGSDIIELGMPFSDPMAEGIVIQKAMEQSLANGMTSAALFEMVAKFRTKDNKTPVVVMGYLNTVEVIGYETFAKKANAAGIDATIIVDLPPEEAEQILSVWHRHQLDMICLCSPTTNPERLPLIASCSTAYAYYVSLKGVTGSGSIDIEDVKGHYNEKRKALGLPLLVGFGIKTPEMAKQIVEFADGVIIGAALLDKINEKNNKAALKNASAFISQIRQAIN